MIITSGVNLRIGRRAQLLSSVGSNIGVKWLFSADRGGAAQNWAGHFAGLGIEWMFDGDRYGAANGFADHDGDAA